MSEHPPVSGADAMGFSNWWAQVESYFDELAPLSPTFPSRFQEIRLYVKVALEFDAGRAAYIVLTGKKQVHRGFRGVVPMARGPPRALRSSIH